MTPCAIGRHQPEPFWVLRPAWVGAGISVPTVHFDKACARCRKTVDRVWSDIVGDTSPLPEAMTLSDWLQRHGATVPAPAGEVRVPDQAEIAGLVAQVDGNRRQRRAAKRSRLPS